MPRPYDLAVRIGRRGRIRRSRQPSLRPMGAAWRWLIRVFRRLDRPLFWAVCYLGLIPAFAGFYMLGASGFYQTSVTHEPTFSNDEALAASGLTQAVWRGILWVASEQGQRIDLSEQPIGYDF